MKIKKSGEDYLEAIYVLQKRDGKVRSVDVVHYLNFSKSSVSSAVNVLRDGGFIEIDSSGYLELTELERTKPGGYMISTVF